MVQSLNRANLIIPEETQKLQKKSFFKKGIFTIFFILFLFFPTNGHGMVTPYTASFINFIVGFSMGSVIQGDMTGFLKFMPAEAVSLGVVIAGVYLLRTLCYDEFSPYAEAGYEPGIQTWTASLGNLSGSSDYMTSFNGVGQFSTRVQVFDGYIVGSTLLILSSTIPFICLRLYSVIRPFSYENSLNRPNFRIPRLKLPKVPVFPEISLQKNRVGKIGVFMGFYIFPQEKRIYKYG